jgi:sugar O-acyltransferase (sialic acid O-acetyltransferase NeuD family)
MKKQQVIVFGNRQIAEVADFYLSHDSPYEVVAFTVDGAYLEESTFQGRPVVPFETLTEAFPPHDFAMFIAMSYQKVNRIRAERYAGAKERGYALVSYVSSKAVTWPGLTIGDNCLILEANVIQPFATIGNNVTLWCGNHIGHHSTIEDHCFLASHVVISGNCTVGRGSFLGVNVTLRDGITVAPESVVGAGALLMKDTSEQDVYPGQPSKLFPIRSSELPGI